jgi:sugar (pentulose or hexulose) kinase
MLEILASVINRPLERLVSSEGPALGAAVVALAGYETQLRRKAGNSTPFSVADAVATMVKFRTPMQPNPIWVEEYQRGLQQFEGKLKHV